MTQTPEDITLTKPVLETVTIAQEFCNYLDSCESNSAKGIMEFMHRILPLLYLKGTFLPKVEVEYPEANERFVTMEQWENMFYMLRDKFGKDDEYWIINPELLNENEPVKASLSENITDIYQDMKDFVLLFKKNTHAARQNAAAECKLLFETHWGYRVGNIIPKIHSVLYENAGEPPAYQQSLDLI
jgi:hypothetical protein